MYKMYMFMCKSTTTINWLLIQDGESDTEVSLRLNRTRQKKFVKNFKQLPSEELVLQREYMLHLVRHVLRTNCPINF
jgi:hypothetical protein